MAVEKRRIADRIMGQVEEYGGVAYEAGFAAGQHKALSLLSATDGARGLTPEFKAELFTMLERIQLFRQSIATYDTRYPKLGEIIADFAKLLGPADAEEGET